MEIGVFGLSGLNRDAIFFPKCTKKNSPPNPHQNPSKKPRSASNANFSKHEPVVVDLKLRYHVKVLKKKIFRSPVIFASENTYFKEKQRKIV
jgi:hypothetical protein